MRSRGICASGYSYLSASSVSRAPCCSPRRRSGTRLPPPTRRRRPRSSCSSSFLDRDRALDARIDTGHAGGARGVHRAGRPDGVAAAPRGTDLRRRQARARGGRAPARGLPDMAGHRQAPARHAPREPRATRRPATGLLDDFTAANAEYQRRLEVNRDKEDGAAALVAVWMTLLVSGLFAIVGGLMAVRMRRRERRRARRAHRAPARPRTRSAPPRSASPRRCR